MDFVKFGAPMQVWQAVVSLTVIFMEDHFLLVWAFSVLTAIVVFSMGTVKSKVQKLVEGRRLKKSLSGDQNTLNLVETPSQRNKQKN